MTRFEMNLEGKFSEFWKKNAEQEILKMQERLHNGEIGVDANGAVYWTSVNSYLPEDCVEILQHTGFSFNAEATAIARKKETAEVIERYRRNSHRPSAEEMFEMRAAFGSGVWVTDAFSGRKTFIS